MQPILVRFELFKARGIIKTPCIHPIFSLASPPPGQFHPPPPMAVEDSALL